MLNEDGSENLPAAPARPAGNIASAPAWPESPLSIKTAVLLVNNPP